MGLQSKKFFLFILVLGASKLKQALVMWKNEVQIDKPIGEAS